MRNVSILYKLIKDYSKKYDERRNEEVKKSIKSILDELIVDYYILGGKRNLEKYRK